LPSGFNPLIGATATGVISLCSLQKLSHNISVDRLAIVRVAILRSPGDEFFKNVKFDEFRTTKKPIYELAHHLRIDN